MATGQHAASVFPLSFVGFLKVDISKPLFSQLISYVLEFFLRFASVALRKQIHEKWYEFLIVGNGNGLGP